jgi:hypothetical membrane protein
MEETMQNAEKLTKGLLTCGVIAGPIYILVGLIQIFIRPGFDPTRNDLSLMSIGPLGWIQIANFIVTGLLVILCAVGIRRVLRGEKAGTWGPLMIGLYGLGLIGAGIFIADPMNGFPPGTVTTATISSHALMHLASGNLGFAGLIAACFVFARRFRFLGQRGWANYSMATGLIFFMAFVGIATGSRQNGATLVFVTLAFTVAVILGWTWISIVAGQLKKRL